MVSTASRNLIVLLALALAFPAGVEAQSFVEHISPPVVERGKTTRVTFVGKNLAKAFDIWNSLPAGTLKAKPVEAASERAVFEITASPDSPVGIGGVRVATPDGLSNLHLFLVDDLPVRPGERMKWKQGWPSRRPHGASFAKGRATATGSRRRRANGWVSRSWPIALARTPIPW